MITLAFDTCLDKMYAVLKKDGEVLASKVIENHDNKYHSAFLISTLQEIMSANSEQFLTMKNDKMENEKDKISKKKQAIKRLKTIIADISPLPADFDEEKARDEYFKEK